MSHGAVTHSNLVEISLTNLREHGLCRLQDRLEAQARQRYGVA
jgi:hypothetical protein